MKIRQGFVSNSSSSSFVIFGEKILPENIISENIKNGNIYVQGRLLNDGYDFFKLTDSMFKDIDYYGLKDFFTFFKVNKVVNVNAVNNKINKKDINFNENGNVFVYTFDVDYHSTENAEQLVEGYLDYKKQILRGY